jgi:hypothetical protein
LIVAVHHPAYSGDGARGSSSKVAKTLDDAFDQSGRRADLVLSGHVHNYQRFTRLFDGPEQIPYIVAGAGGYPAKHYLLSGPNGKKIEVPLNIRSRAGVNLTLENYSDKRLAIYFWMCRKIASRDDILQQHTTMKLSTQSPSRWMISNLFGVNRN